MGIGEWMGEGDNAIASDHGTLAAEENSIGIENKENAGIALSSVEESRKQKSLCLKKTDKRRPLRALLNDFV